MSPIVTVLAQTARYKHRRSGYNEF